MGNEIEEAAERLVQVIEESGLADADQFAVKLQQLLEKELGLSV